MAEGRVAGREDVDVVMMRFGRHFAGLAALGLAAMVAVTGCQSAAGTPAQAASAPALNNKNSTQAVAPNAAPAPATGGSAQVANMGASAKPANETAKVDLAAMKARVDAKDTSYMLIDARMPNEYAAGHVPTAKNLPATDLMSKMSTLPKDKELIVYCYGRGCSISRTFALKLTEAGFPNVKELDGGVPEWQAAGYQLEK